MKKQFGYMIVLLLIIVMTAAGCSSKSETGTKQKEDSRGWESIPSNASGGKTTDDAKKSAEAEEHITAAEDGEESAEDGEESAEDGKESAEDSEETEEDGEAAEGEEEQEEEEIIIPVPEDVAGVYSEELFAFMEERNLHEGNFAVAFKNLETGEYCYFNELKMWDACSTYKLPLNLLYYDMEADGKISGDDLIGETETTLNECHQKSLQFSNNELSEAMMDELGNYYYVKQNMRKYFTLDDSEIDPDYYTHNYYCARMMMDCAAYLYSHQNQYADAWTYLTAAQPGQYLRRKIGNEVIAQKYGKREDLEHCAGVVTGEHPFAIAVYTENAGGDELIGSVSALFYELVNRS